MILIHFTPDGLRRTADLRNILFGRTAFLIGGAPSLNEQPIQLLEQRGVLSMAMNNAAKLFRPTLWCCGDNPSCFEPQILCDPTIMKFMAYPWVDKTSELMEANGDNRKMRQLANLFFYMQRDNPPWDEYLATFTEIPWYRNTLLVSIHLLYQLGVRRLILGGSDFQVGDGKRPDYAHGQCLGAQERSWNKPLYDNLARELRLLKPIFDRAGLQFFDSSKYSRLGSVYEHITLERGVEMCLENFPKKQVEASALPHCSRYAPEHIKEAMGKWPGHENEKSNGVRPNIPPEGEDGKLQQELVV